MADVDPHRGQESPEERVSRQLKFYGLVEREPAEPEYTPPPPVDNELVEDLKAMLTPTREPDGFFEAAKRAVAEIERDRRDAAEDAYYPEDFDLTVALPVVRSVGDLTTELAAIQRGERGSPVSPANRARRDEIAKELRRRA